MSLAIDGQDRNAGIHIPSCPVVPDDSKAVRTSEITPKVVLWTSKVLLNHNVFSKFSDNVIMYLSSDHFLSTYCQIHCIALCVLQTSEGF